MSEERFLHRERPTVAILNRPSLMPSWMTVEDILAETSSLLSLVAYKTVRRSWASFLLEGSSKVLTDCFAPTDAVSHLLLNFSINVYFDSPDLSSQYWWCITKHSKSLFLLIWFRPSYRKRWSFPRRTGTISSGLLLLQKSRNRVPKIWRRNRTRYFPAFPDTRRVVALLFIR